jgi:arginyl-tRNA synthetase
MKSMSLVEQIKEATAKTIENIYKIDVFADDMVINQTKPEFEGDYTIVLFALVKKLKKAPEELGKEIGEQLISSSSLFTSYNVIKGFLNLSVADENFISFLTSDVENKKIDETHSSKIIVEYSSPNTNKPLHLGHLRNNFLGWSVAEILKAIGNDVKKTSIVNDRGVHICKSMIAWQLFANGETPEKKA